MTDGGQDINEHVDEETIEEAIDRHDDPDHPDALTVYEVRDILSFEQRAVEEWWSELMDNIEDGYTDVVADTGELLILATGEHQMYGEELVDYYCGEDPPEQVYSVLSYIHHEVARSHSDYNWSTTNPFVVRKPADAQMGQRYVEALVNGLQKKGLTPAQSWAVYGVHAAGYSRNAWASMCGHGDHSAVSQALRKVNKETPHIPLAD